MKKYHLRRLYHSVSSISYWWFVVVCIISGLTAVLALRHNNQRMIELRNHVFAVDKANGDIEGALRDLREFIYGHMNTELAAGPNAVRPPIQLKYRYERLQAAEKQRVSSVNSNLYNEAQVVCERQYPENLTTSGRIPCIKQYVDSRSTKEQPINDDLYKFDFISPRWSPDLAGWSIVLTVASALLFINRLAAEYWLKRELHRHM